MDAVPIGVLWRFLSWLPGFVLRWFFSKRWLADHTRIDIRPRHDPVSVYGGELPQVQFWIIVANRGHFPIELDRLTVEFSFAAVNTQFYKLDRIQLAADSEAEVFVRGVLTGEQAVHIAKYKDRPQIALQLKAEFNSKVHNFAVDTGRLEGINPALSNL